VSDPRISTLENHEAVFKFETIIPIQTINRFTEGAATSDIVTFEDEEVRLSLRVTPRINEVGTITLDIEPKVEDIIGFNGPPENKKPITSSRSIRTRITIADGETVALGGLLKENDIETVKTVPLFGSIPLLGRLLFTHTSKTTTTTDLTILITPHILD
jgi:type II secretory pathway component GspD/PulD (secretin)